MTLTVERLGARGDGVATYQGRPVFLANALPGERLVARLTGERAGGFKGEVIELLVAAPERIEAPCPHFGPCGGCSLQQLAPEAYRTWKRDLLLTALARRDLQPHHVAAMAEVAARSRRRIALGALHVGGGLQIGFREREGHRIVDVKDCALMLPGLQALIGPLRELLHRLLARREGAEAILTTFENGVDLQLVLPRDPGLEGRELLQGFAQAQDLARLTWRRPDDRPEDFEPLAVRRDPFVSFGAVRVNPPPGAFLQPTEAGERILCDFLMDSLPERCGQIVELFAGCGSFTFPLAARAPVMAFEGDGPALRALKAACNAHVLNARIQASRRDLERDPVSAKELRAGAFDALVFDPPRQGARAQSVEIAESGIPRVVALSCSPGSFARDARILVDGGYRLEKLLPLDQFPWSGHLELAALFVGQGPK